MRNVLTMLIFIGIILPALAINYEYSFKHNNASILLEKASTLEEKRQGLMHRDFLDKNTGMVFLYDDYYEQSFWMKNVKFPLDIIFMRDEKVVKIFKSLRPCKGNYCPSYHSGGRINKVIELNGGFCEKNKIKEGDEIKLRKVHG